MPGWTLDANENTLNRGRLLARWKLLIFAPFIHSGISRRLPTETSRMVHLFSRKETLSCRRHLFKNAKRYDLRTRFLIQCGIVKRFLLNDRRCLPSRALAPILQEAAIASAK